MENITKELLNAVNQAKHGIVKLKEPLVTADGDIVVNITEEGIITAYLPEMKKFSVMFSNNKWYTFDESEEEFLNRVIKIKSKDEELGIGFIDIKADKTGSKEEIDNIIKNEVEKTKIVTKMKKDAHLTAPELSALLELKESLDTYEECFTSKTGDSEDRIPTSFRKSYLEEGTWDNLIKDIVESPGLKSLCSPSDFESMETMLSKLNKHTDIFKQSLSKFIELGYLKEITFAGHQRIGLNIPLLKIFY